MKTLFAFTAALLISFTLLADEERVASSKDITLEFSSWEQLNAWDYHKIPFEQWLKDVTFDDAQLLYSEETPVLYAAVFRFQSWLIIWTNDLEDQYPNGSTSAYTPEGKPAWEKPSYVAVLSYELNCPTGGVTYVDNAIAYKIPGDYQGPILIKKTLRTEADQKLVAIDKSIDWE